MSANPIAEAWDDLDEHLSAIEPGDLTGDFDDADKAERLLRHVLRHRRQLAADEAVARSQVEQVERWLESRRKAHDTSYVESVLRDYHEARLARDPKVKTIHLPSGTLTARKLPDRWEFDEEAFLAWAQDRRADLVRIKTEIDKPAAKKALRVLDDGQIIDGASGEFVPAVSVTPGELSFAIKQEDENQ